MITYYEDSGVFCMETADSTYQMRIDSYGYLTHLYYGKKVPDASLSYLSCRADHGFSGNPYDAGKDRTFSTDTLLQEYSTFGAGDYRTSCLSVIHPDGSNILDLRYESYRILDGKPPLEGLPASYGEKGEVQTLEIDLKDKVKDVMVTLSYSVYDKLDAIARSARIINRGNGDLYLESALSVCLDLYTDQYDILTFYGRHGGERSEERTPLRHGKIVTDSVRGASSHQQNPSAVLCSPQADEDNGECCGMTLMYSGNFAFTAEVDPFRQTRLTLGVNPEGFRWRLPEGESFQTPEALLVYSSGGLGGMSRQFHRLIREHVCRGRYKDIRRPILINNWEATYFDFNDDKLAEIADTAAGLGVEMLVMDDGWFGKRDSDYSGLGDWTVNENKLRGGLGRLCGRIQAMGMRFGIWVEPEMISEDSELYRRHPDWCLQAPGRKGVRSRYQYVLDMSCGDVLDYLYDSLSAVLCSADISYVKWDMNRHLSDVWSAKLPADRQGEVWHRYVLGLYELLERLTGAFPHILFEGCAGGGGRFDAGMLYYTPQIWCSDNTDAAERIEIQRGTSFIYPISAVGAHVSTVPNHMNGRVTPLKTRALVAMAGTFGYELDLNELSPEEKEEIREQIHIYKDYYEVINRGDYYRLTGGKSGGDAAAWQFVGADGGRSLAVYVQLHARANSGPYYLRLRGLEPEQYYQVKLDGAAMENPISGGALMYAGLMIPPMPGDYRSVMIEIGKADRACAPLPADTDYNL